MSDRVRVVVQEPGRLLREGLAGLLAANEEVDLVAAVASADDVPASEGAIDVVLTGRPVPPSRWPDAAVVRFGPGDTLASLIEAVLLPVAHLGADPGDVEAVESAPILTSRQLEVVRGLAAGLSTSEIGAALTITAKSVDNHKQQIYARLGARNGAHAIVLAREAGLLSPCGEGVGR